MGFDPGSDLRTQTAARGHSQDEDAIAVGDCGLQLIEHGDEGALGCGPAEQLQVVEEHHRPLLCLAEDVLAGAALILGARGLLTGCFNFMMPVFAMMVGAARRGDYGRVAELWRLTLPLIVCLASNPYTSGVKTACQILGHDVGPVRSPLPSISAKGRRDLDANIAALNPAYFA